eukprot:IDg10351t1
MQATILASVFSTRPLYTPRIPWVACRCNCPGPQHAVKYSLRCALRAALPVDTRVACFSCWRVFKILFEVVGVRTHPPVHSLPLLEIGRARGISASTVGGICGLRPAGCMAATTFSESSAALPQEGAQRGNGAAMAGMTRALFAAGVAAVAVKIEL